LTYEDYVLLLRLETLPKRLFTSNSVEPYPFRPAIGLSNRHLQTLYPALFKRASPPKIEIERFELDDGDFVDCYWHHRPGPEESRPIVTLFHGLDGSFESSYIQRIMYALETIGFSTVLMHFRGCSGEPNRLPRSYHSGETGDAKAWIASLVKRYPKNLLFAVGYSLGGNMLLKLLGEYGDTSPLTAAVSISAPMQLEISADTMDQGFSKFYQFLLMRGLKRALLKKYRHHDMHALLGVDEKRIKKIRSFWEFDDVYTGPAHGFSGAREYYAKSSAKQFLSAISTDTLIIQALDDPFMTPEVLPEKRDLSVHVKLEISKHGGHVGFVGGTLFKPHYWLDGRIADFFKSRL